MSISQGRRIAASDGLPRNEPDLPGSDDPAGGGIGVLIAFASPVMATAAAVFERSLQNAVDIKSENDLTI